MWTPQIKSPYLTHVSVKLDKTYEPSKHQCNWNFRVMIPDWVGTNSDKANKLSKTDECQPGPNIEYWCVWAIDFLFASQTKWNSKLFKVMIPLSVLCYWVRLSFILNSLALRYIKMTSEDTYAAISMKGIKDATYY